MSLISLKNNKATINTCRYLYTEKLLPIFVPSDIKLQNFTEDKDPTDSEITRRERHLQKVNTVLAGMTIVVADEMIAGNLTGLLTSEFGDIGKRIRTIREVMKLKTLRTSVIWVPFPLDISEYEHLDAVSVRSTIYIGDSNLVFQGEQLTLEDDTDSCDEIVTLLPTSQKIDRPEPGTECVITAIPPRNFYNFVGETIRLRKYGETRDIYVEAKGKRSKNIGKCSIMPKNIINNVNSLLGRSHNTKIINLSGDTTLLNLYGYTNIL